MCAATIASQLLAPIRLRYGASIEASTQMPAEIGSVDVAPRPAVATIVS
ncbi:MAG: hypothetical protein ACREPW_06600 [Candidatus Binataceae bacterium]